MKKNIKKSSIYLKHYWNFIFRSVLFGTVFILYIYQRTLGNSFVDLMEKYELIMGVIWFFFMFEMIFRMFPSKFESIGCQKQFKKNYIPVESDIKLKPEKQSWKKTFLIAVLWILGNSIFGILYYLKLIDEGILILLFLAYAICDTICILFFCPFQTWIMKNKCCTSCRIYNWDFMMMVTPLIFIKSVYSYTLVFLAFIILLEWEIKYRKYPERYTENTNKILDCKCCQEKLCLHKTQLRKFLIKQKTMLRKIKNDIEKQFKK